MTRLSAESRRGRARAIGVALIASLLIIVGVRLSRGGIGR